MRPRSKLVVAAALAFALPGLTRAQTGSLRVIRVTPTTDANPFQQISVTFDRPVAGSLDRAVDPATILRIEPAVRGRLEWRDPVTIRLTPTSTLAPGAQYTVTVANNFRAMDGSALSEPYTFTFRAHGQLLLTGSPVWSGSPLADHVAPNQRFSLVYSSPVELPVLTGTSYVELSATCGGEKVVRLEAVSQRAVQSDDQMQLREAGGWNRDRSLDSLRRIVQLVPRSPLPRACTGLLVVPTEITDQGSRGSARWPFETYGDLKLTSLACSESPVKYCPTGPLVVAFTNPVRGSEVAKRLRMLPDTKFSVRDTIGEAMTWTLETKVKPRVSYAVIADTALRDVYGQPIRGNPAAGFNTTGFEPTIIHAMGHLLVEKLGFRTLAVQHVNVDTLVATIAPVPQELERQVLSRDSWRDDSLWPALARGATVTRIPVRAGTLDHALITGIPFPTVDASRTKASPLFALRVEGHSAVGPTVTSGATTIVQVTDLGIHAKIGMTEGAVWVTGVSDGAPRAGATIVLYDGSGRDVATTRTNAQGLARFTNLGGPPTRGIEDPPSYSGFEGYVSAQLGADRAVVAINRWDPDLSPWRFNVASAWDDERLPLAGAVFTERGIYRPTERVYAKAIIRSGPLGSLRAPAAGDSIKWLFHDREEGMLREATVPLSAFGTSDQSLELPSTVAVGYYTVGVQVKRLGKWRNVAQTSYRVAEYRPPEFLVDVNRADSTGVPGGKLTAKLQARYLFGAPMGRAVVSWQARQTALSPWQIEIPGLEDWYVGETGNWWEEQHDEESRVFASSTDTLDSRGTGTYTATIPESQKGRPSRITIEATVTDVNRQAVGANTSLVVFPADFSLAAKPLGASYFWRVGTPQRVGVVAAHSDGKKVPGVAVQGTIVRREWHRVRRERDGVSELVGEWVSDSVAQCAVMTTDSTSICNVTPKEGGIYVVKLTAKDRGGRVASTSFERWVVGPDWVPWSDETQFKMDVISDRPRYAVGDTATVLFAAPFTNAEAWVTVEREGLIEQRRIRITSGSTTLKFPITEAYAPNAFISILVARGRSAPPGSLDDDGRPTIRVGYAELRVTPEVKRLAVAIETDKPEYRPADSARVRVHVRDALSHGSKSEVTLWAVDEGVLSLTGYKTPDPIDLIYKERGLGLRLASNMTSVAPQIPEGEKGKREAGGGGGAAGAEILRSRFKTTAFFLGSVVTDAEGNGVAVAKLPDNLTTFRIMAVAVTAGDRYGKGESSLLVTRPLLARQALPRFVREGDAFNAGAVINRRDGAAVTVSVKAAATGVNLRGSAERSTTLAALRGSEVRFPFQTPRVGDSATFRFDVTDNQNADAVQVKIPIRPDFHPVTSTIAGMLTDTATVSIPVPAGLDQARSRLSLSVGVSPLTAVRGMYRALRVYPYDCSEQVISEATPIIALYRVQPKGIDSTLGVDPRREIERAVAVLTSRQRSDGAIGYWSSTDWTTAWLSAYAGLVMLDARAAGIRVDTLVLSRLGDYLNQALHGTLAGGFTPVAYWYSRRDLVLRDQLAAVDFMSRAGRADVAAENELLRNAAQMLVEDRARLAEVLVRRGQMEPARRLMESAWSLVRVEGRKAVLPDSAVHPFYFWSSVRPYAQLLMGTLAVDPNHSLIGPLAESVVEQGRAARGWFWTTQDFGAAASALGALERRQRALGERSVRVVAGKRVIVDGARDSSVSLQGLVTRQSGQDALQLSLQASPGEGSVYYFLSVTQIPSAQPVTPEEHGIRVERWYERFETGNPTTTAAEGDLVRVRLRLTVPTTRTFVVLDDALPAGLEAVDLSLRTAAAVPGPGVKPADEEADKEERAEGDTGPYWYGSWDSGWWSPFDHRELRDDRVVYSASMLWPGTYTATYIARATTPGTFIKPPAHAEEMYNPAVYGRSDGGTFVVTPRGQ